MANKPILFNTRMVQAIMEGHKTQTRRVCKGQGECNPVQCGYHPPFKPGDILWVRETWHKDAGRYMYRANYSKDEKFYRNGQEVEIRWSPSIHMPKEAARIFLRVKDVWVERLRDIHEKYEPGPGHPVTQEGLNYTCDFIATWENTIKPADRDRYGWNANPWVWVIKFERCDKPEGWCG